MNIIRSIITLKFNTFSFASKIKKSSNNMRLFFEKKTTFSNDVRIDNSQTTKYQNSMNSFTYWVISKCIFFRNLIVDNIIKIKSIESYQYCHVNLSIFWRRRFSFLRTINENCFFITIVRIFRWSFNKNMWRRIWRLKIFNLNKKLWIIFKFFKKSKKTFSISWKISLNRT